jgi:signal transduction histidine kinase
MNRYSTALATAGVAALVALTLWGLADAGTDRLPLDVAVAIAATASVPAMRRWPVAATVVATTLAVLSPAATPPATYGALVVAQRRRFPVALAVGVGGVAAHGARGWWQPAGGLSYAWWLLLVTVAYGAIIGWGQLSQARWALMASLRQRARRAEEEQAARVAEARVQERHRIAREMHDVLAHRLSLVATYAGALEYRPEAPPEQRARAAGVIREGVAQALAELRDVIGVLRDLPSPGSDEHQPTRPQPVWADLPRLVAEAREAGQEASCDDRVTSPAPPDGLARTAYRVVQEGLTNARRHAPGVPVNIVLSGQSGGELVIEVRNPAPSAGAPWSGAPPGRPGLGLAGLTERVELAGGALRAGPAGGEFRLRVSLPWPA